MSADPIEALFAIARAVDRLAAEVAALGKALPNYEIWSALIENLRTDHPLQGETFGGLDGALEHIAQAIEQISDK